MLFKNVLWRTEGFVKTLGGKWRKQRYDDSTVYSMVTCEVKKCYSVKSMVRSVWSVSHRSIRRIDPTFPKASRNSGHTVCKEVLDKWRESYYVGFLGASVLVEVEHASVMEG